MGADYALRELPVETLLGRLASAAAAPASGSAAALSAAMAAALVSKVARRSPDWADGPGAAAQAAALQARSLELAELVAFAFEEALIALEEREQADDFALGSALARAGEAPLRIAETAADVAELAAVAAEEADPSFRPDAAVAATLAAAAAAAGEKLVAVNLLVTPADGWATRARDAATAAAEACGRALATSE